MPSSPTELPLTPADPIRQRQAMTRRLERRIACDGKITLPAVPGMLDDYTSRCEQLFAALGRKLSDAERQQLRGNLASQLAAAFAASQRSSITVSYQAKVGGMLNYVIAPQHAKVEQVYEEWVNTRQPPYFGLHPDAKALDVAQQVLQPNKGRVLDVGAGTGRNAIPLARLGHRVDAVELTPKFAELLGQTARQESLSIRVICQDVFQASPMLAPDYQMILVSEVISDFRSAQQLRDLLELAARHLAPGGRLVINVFLTQNHYSQDDAAREFAQQVYSFYLTPTELSEVSANLPLALESNQSALDYEKSKQPPAAWPPTSWYPEWSAGMDVFDVPREQSAIDLRWLVYRKTAN